MGCGRRRKEEDLGDPDQDERRERHGELGAGLRSRRVNGLFTPQSKQARVAAKADFMLDAVAGRMSVSSYLLNMLNSAFKI